ncbi:MAG TPA: hypothetical protein VJR23_02295 [Candidatus Acidoferrales bacterium]|nr:hypothetical protein [Candidatus Acidoferrales bacterium]
MAATESADDALECNAIVRPVEAKYPIPESTSTPNRSAIFCDTAVNLPLPTKYDLIKIYGVTNAAEQNAIVQTVQDFRRQFRTKRILVEFYRAENWRKWSDPKTGNSGGSRGPEILIGRNWVN